VRRDPCWRSPAPRLSRLARSARWASPGSFAVSARWRVGLSLSSFCCVGVGLRYFSRGQASGGSRGRGCQPGSSCGARFASTGAATHATPLGPGRVPLGRPRSRWRKSPFGLMQVVSVHAALADRWPGGRRAKAGARLPVQSTRWFSGSRLRCGWPRRRSLATHGSLPLEPAAGPWAAARSPDRRRAR